MIRFQLGKYQACPGGTLPYEVLVPGRVFNLKRFTGRAVVYIKLYFNNIQELCKKYVENRKNPQKAPQHRSRRKLQTSEQANVFNLHFHLVLTKCSDLESHQEMKSILVA